MSNTAPLVLASTSPRRRELITLFDVAFQFTFADIDEAPRDHESPEQLVRRLSRAKAELGARDQRDAIVIGADTIGWLDDAIIGKPCDLDDAARMLKQLRARPHIVYSGITVQQSARALTQVATTTVWMRDYSDAEIAAYITTGDPLDKAAAYAIQHAQFHPVARVDGCHANVMGLPLCHLYRALKSFGIAIAEPDRACQAHLNITCPVARDILSDQCSVFSVQYSVASRF
jgi:MAF protein